MLLWDDGKAPGEVEDFDVDWTLRLAGDTIIDSIWEITVGDAAPGSLKIEDTQFTSNFTKVVLSGGTLGVTYTLTNTIIPASNPSERLIEQIQLPVRDTTFLNSLTTLANAIQWLGAKNDDDGKIARLLAGISVQIQSFLGYNVLQSPYDRTFDGQGTRQLFTPDRPLVSVQSLTIDGVSIPKGVVSGGTQRPGFYNNANAIGLVGGYYFSRGFQNIAASYTAGYATVPYDIEQAALEWTKMLWTTGTMPFPGNVVKVQAGDTMLDFGGGGNVTDTKKIPMPTSIYSILSGYRRVVGVSGI